MDMPVSQPRGEQVPKQAPSRTGARTRTTRPSLGSVPAWVRGQLTSTPGRLGLASVLVVIGALILGSVAFSAERARSQAAQAVASQTEPLLVEAVTLYAALSDADATATTTFLKGGLEPPARRARYENDLRMATTSLAELSRQVGDSATARNSVATITDGLPFYSGLVEAARADNRQRLPVGAAYLRQSSELLSTSILPAAGRLYETEAMRLNADYRSGTATATLVAFLALMLAALVLLLLEQRYLARISRRILNLPMVAATVVLLALTVWGLVALLGEQSALASAQRSGSDSVEVLSATRILASRAQSDESLWLVARGGDDQPASDFAAVMQALGGPNGLLAEVAALAQRTGTTAAANGLQTTFAAYRSRHDQITALATGGRFQDAVNLEVNSAATGVSPSDRLSAGLAAEIAAAQRRFEHDAGDATSALSGLSIAIPLLAALAAVLALLGLRQRINEYR
jgi:hypothetical protein